MNKITVFTPTYNRKDLLGRLYNSLLTQEFKDFVWLIVDDGSSDGTEALVNEWVKEGKLSITYKYKENGGKFSAFHTALELCKTKYLVTVDSDNLLLKYSISTFYNTWENIEKSNLSEKIAEIRALSIYPDGKIVGSNSFLSTVKYIDTTWHYMTLKKRNNCEMISSWNVQMLKTVIDPKEVFWLAGKFKYFSESVYWARLGKKYKTRYLNEALQVYYEDAANSIQRESNKDLFYYNELVSSKYMVDESIEYFFWHPRFFISPIIKFCILCHKFNISFSEVIKVIKTPIFKVVFIFLYPFSYIHYLYLKNIKKRFW